MPHGAENTDASCAPSAGRRSGGMGLIILAVGAIYSAVALYLMVSAEPERLVTIIVDDAYYYVAVAEDIAAGRPPSLDDGISTTTGFHPAFAFALAALFRVVPPEGAFGTLRLLLLLSSLLHIATGVVIYLLVRRFTRPLIAGAAGGLWLVNPRTIAVLGEGVESALYGLTIALALLTLDWALAGLEQARGTRRSRARAAALGAALALAMLARSDAIALAGAVLIIVLVAEGVPRRGWRDAAVAGAIMVVTATVVLLPWLIYAQSVSGHWWQDSGTMKRLWRAHTLSGLSFAGTLKFVVLLARRYLLGSLQAVPVMPLVAAFSLGLVTARPAQAEAASATQERRERLMIAAILTTVALLTVAYAGFFDSVRVWYFMPAAVGGMVLVGILAERAVRVLEASACGATCRMVIVAALVIISFSYLENCYDVVTGPGRSPHQAYTLEAARWVARNIPSDAVIGAFNAGTWWQFSEHTVVNLDGLMNGDAVVASRTGRLHEYAARHVDYIADFDYVTRYFEWFGDPRWADTHLRVVRTFPGEMEGSRLTLWRVVGGDRDERSGCNGEARRERGGGR